MEADVPVKAFIADILICQVGSTLKRPVAITDNTGSSVLDASCESSQRTRVAAARSTASYLSIRHVVVAL